MLSNLFYIINFSISIIFSIVALIFAFTTIIIFLINRQCRNVANLLICNIAISTVSYHIIIISSIGYSLHEDWLFHQPACVFRGYCYMVSCTALAYSFLIQAISRLFFAVFYKHKYLQTWRIHWIMIIINWILAILLPIVPIFLNGYILEIESRLCVPTSKVLSSAMYIILIIYLPPLNSIGIIYGIILYYARQSTRRVVAFAARTDSTTVTPNIALPNFKRELKMMRNMVILLGIFMIAGALDVSCVVWHASQTQPLPEALYLLNINSITVSIASMMTILFFMSKEVKNTTIIYLRKVYGH